MEQRSGSRDSISSGPSLPRTGRYQLLNPLGRGAFGQVFACYDPVLDRRLAVKVLSGELPANLREEFLERFWVEVRVLARLSHPNVVMVHDAGLEGSYPYVVMELCSGPSLDGMLGRLPRGTFALPLCQAAWLIVQVARALDYVHSRGVVHRDVKPANLMFHDGALKLTDFGLAHTALSNLTSAGQVLGTPAFMSPEQVRGEQIDHRSDLYSMGALLFQLLTGRSPFLGTPYAIMSQLVHSEPPVFSEVASSLNLPALLPAGLDAFFARALAREPEGRYSSGAELCEALFAIIPEEGLRPVEGLEQLGQSELPDALSTIAMVPEGSSATAHYRSVCDDPAGVHGNETGRTRAFPEVVVLEGRERATVALASSQACEVVVRPGIPQVPPFRRWGPDDRLPALPADRLRREDLIRPSLPFSRSGRDDRMPTPPLRRSRRDDRMPALPLRRSRRDDRLLPAPPLSRSRRDDHMAPAPPLSSVSRLRRRSPWVLPALMALLMLSAFFGWEWQASQAQLELFPLNSEPAGKATVDASTMGYECDVIGEAVSASGRPSDASGKVRRRTVVERKVVARSVPLTPASSLAPRTPREEAAEDLPIPAISSPPASSPSASERIHLDVRFEPQIAR